ncbi:hypothetical protein [Helicobacter cynogastricus]|uniref:hypothetical protein n=1 Tax=Helicobacter cynogastricus TaxID=329937 RepID=UPI000CF1375C|nr:hypothetical protein [Helicobacter cynogastricus]
MEYWAKKGVSGILGGLVELVDKALKEGREKGENPKLPKYRRLQGDLNVFLAKWGYVCRVTLGIGNLSGTPGMVITRQDILGKGFVNYSKKSIPSAKKRFRICFWRGHEQLKYDEGLYFGINCADWEQPDNNLEVCKRCLAYKKIRLISW